MIVGLTGGIGSGKSTVARYLEILDCAVFNSDQEAKAVYFDSQVRKKVTQLLGSEVYMTKNGLNKNFINSKIFNNTDLLHQLNNIIHPAVKDRFLNFLKHSKKTLIFKESALLFEAKLEKEVDKIILVLAHDELRIKRVMERDMLSREEVIKKIKSQLPQSEKIKKADFVIYNNEHDFIITQVNQIKAQLI